MSFFAPFVVETGALRGRPPRDHRRTLDAIFWIAHTGAPWHDLPEDLGNWNAMHRQYRRWTASRPAQAVNCRASSRTGSMPSSNAACWPAAS